MAARTHVVLVPGFGGFDALGKLVYYAGVTDAFARWRSTSSGDRGTAVLHYFDNLPTAAVSTRAKSLRRYLKKLIDRQVIQGQDPIVIAGHSTGGLDLRQLVIDLEASREADADSGELLARIQRLVFLSVPQRGTNIADWVRSYRRSAETLVSVLRQAVGLKVPLSLAPARLAVRQLALGAPQLFDAVEDTHREIAVPRDVDALVRADARHTEAEVNLWLADTESDFLAIDDLASARAGGRRLVDDGEPERAIWQRHGLSTRSYATLGRCPFDPDAVRVRRDQLLSLSSLVAAARTQAADSDVVYRVSYAACAGGPFRSSATPAASWLPGCAPPASSPTHAPEDWENDGIVNTASMLWPDGPATRLVAGDHADIIGHFRLKPGALGHPRGRKYDSYDLLGSGSRFTQDQFEAVWRDVFDWAVPS